eukprot:CAMPEP_0117672832 /NCGR_PEP_ID=MMETSP0804-20121206/14128_1 /TAXON_ID=1074897 /ORGANISM="Tetraselmis astigmatica, Strain CCMP880" /LENGTH=336 /DNA_ID=CAMNT_0005481487 /DNA_START=23 /DNA_END=1033 /DNA_ORIENTATION=+
MGASASLEERMTLASEQHQDSSAQNPISSSSYEVSPCSNSVRHVRIKRHFMGLEPFFHHGVDLGDGHVAHYCKQNPFEPARVRITTWQRFLRDGVESAEEVEHSNQIAAEKVRQSIVRLYGRKEYNLLFCNCEHFASFCVCGTFRSSQVEEVLEGFEAIHRALGTRATSLLFSGERGGSQAPFMHKKPNWAQMAAVSALDIAASGVKLALQTVHRYTLRQAGSFEEAVAGGGSGHSSDCVCNVSPVSTCPCCSQGTLPSNQREDGGPSSNASGSWWPQGLDPGTILCSALSAGINGITWLTASNPTESLEDGHGESVEPDRSLIYRLDSAVSRSAG